MRKDIARRSSWLTLAVALATATPAIAGAQSLSGSLSVDDLFTVYLSTSPTTQGAPIASGTNWQTTYSFGPTALTPGQNYWLQVAASNTGGPGGFIGDFTLTGPFLFANGASTIGTNTTDWTLQTGSFAGPTAAMMDEGANGVGPWGTRPGISPSTHWIWDVANTGVGTLYFSTPIVAQRVTPPGSTVPEPSTWMLMGTGLVAVGAMTRRRRLG